MHGVPADLDLVGFHGAMLIQICLGEHTVQFVFQPIDVNPLRYIMVEGGWEVHEADGSILDQEQPHTSRESYRLHRLLGRSVTGSSVDAPRSFALRFDSGAELRVFDDSEPYESFSIQPGDVFV